MTAPPTLNDNPHIALDAWRKARHEHPYVASRVVFAGITVTKFSWKYQTLGSWENSRELLDAAMAKWLNVSPARRFALKEPGRDALKHFLTKQLPHKLMKGDLLILYLGTHHLKDGRILLSGKDSITARDLAQWLSQIPQRSLLISDVCYSAAMEDGVPFPSRCTRLHASPRGQPAPDVGFDPGTNASRKFFARTLDLIENDLGLKHKRYSQMGILVTQALQQVMAAAAERLTVNALCRQFVQENKRFDKDEPSFSVPIGVLANPKSATIAVIDRREKYLQTLLSMLRDGGDLSFERGIWAIAGLYDPALSIADARKKVDVIQQALSDELENVSDPLRVIGVLNDYFFAKAKLKSVPDPYPEDFLLPLLLSEKRGRCAALTALYLVIAERLKLPLQATCLPEHILVRWPTQDGGINIETTEGGKRISNEDYRRIRPWKKTDGAQAFYLRPLNMRQTLATYLSPLGSVLRIRGETALAKQVLQLSVEVNPSDAEAWNNLGMVQAQAGKLRDAKAAYRRAIVINPLLAEAWNNLGNATVDPAARLGFFQKAVALKPALGPAWANLSLTWRQLGKPGRALECAKQAGLHGHELSPQYIQLLNRLVKPKTKQ